jgi:hypothetical protein
MTPSRGQRTILLAAAIAPALLPLYVIWRYGVNSPFMDEWDFVRDLHLASQQGNLASHLFTQFNESRPAFSRLLFLLLAKISGNDFRAGMIASWLVACGTAWNLWRLVRPGNDVLSLAAAAVASLYILSPIQYETWLWGNQVIVLLPMLFLTSALRLLQSERLAPPVSLGGALACGFLGMFSFSGGLLCLPAIGAAIALGLWPHWKTHRKLAVVAWLSVFIGALAIYFVGYRKPPSALEPVPFSLLSAIRYYLNFLGSVHSNGEPFVALLSGLFLLIAFAWLAFNNRKSPQPALLTLAGFVIVAAALTTIGRLDHGIVQSLSIRYLSVSLYLTVAVLGLAMHSGNRIVLALVLGAFAASGTHALIRGLVFSYGDWRGKMYGRACVSLSSQTIQGCSTYLPYPDWYLLAKSIPVMEQLGFLRPGLYRQSLPSPDSTPAGRLEFGNGVINGWAEHQADPLHAIILANAADGKWFGIAMVSDPFERIFKWQAVMSLPPGVRDVAAYGYNADTGKAVFLAKGTLPAP